MGLLPFIRRRPLGSLLTGGFLLLLVLQFGAVWLRPLVRPRIDHPLFTVGDAQYASALLRGRRVAKLGPLPLRIYRGGMAFANAREAILYLQHRSLLSEGWAVYELSGDFQLDTYEINGKRRTNKTLLVTRRVAPEMAAHMPSRR